MEYSLQTLNENSNLTSIKSLDIIEKLNLIGFEIDETVNDSFITNPFIDNLKLLIKIPANREDLLNEKIFLIELSTIFFLELNHIWEKLKLNYSFILKEKYLTNLKYENLNINDIFEISEKDLNFLIFNIEIEIKKDITSPLWIQNKLLNSGLPVTNNIIDLLTLTNLEWGQNFKLLDYNLNEEKKSNTFDILNNPGLESYVVGKKMIIQSSFYDIHQDNSVENISDNKLFIKSLRKTYLENFKFAFQRLLSLFEIIGVAKIIPRISFTIPSKIELKTNKILKLKKQLLKRILNLDLIDTLIFKKAGLKIVCETKDEFYFFIPNYRNDLVREIDLIEEYSRFIGYRNFVPIFPEKVTKYFRKSDQNIKFIKQFFLSYGFQEILTSPLQDIKKNQKNSIFIQNPLNSELNLLRTTLLEKLIITFENNIRLGIMSKNFFEIGRVFEKRNKNLIEKESLGGIFQLQRIKKGKLPTIEWFIAKGFLENFFLHFGYDNLSFEKIEEENFLFHPTKSIYIKKNNEILGFFGEIHPKIELAKTSKIPTYLFEFDLEFFNKNRMNSFIPIYQESSKYPIITKDISFLISKEINFYQLKQRLQKISGILKKVQFFDIYFDENLLNNVNIGIRFHFQSNLETLTTQVIDTELTQIKTILLTEFKAQFKL